MHKVLIGIGILLMVGLGACKHEIPDPVIEDPTNPVGNDGPFDPLPTPEGCDSNVVYFQQDILPFFTARCGFDGCHSSGTNEDGITLDNYGDIIADLDIEVDDPYDNEFHEVVIENNQGDDDYMPPYPDYAPLTQDQIDMVFDWILQGAQNNSCEGCVTENITYEPVIGTLIQNRCQGCHSGTSPDGGILLTNYELIKNQALNGPLLDAVQHTGNATPMPYNSAQLPQCEIDQIEAWINAGAPLN